MSTETYDPQIMESIYRDDYVQLAIQIHKRTI